MFKVLLKELFTGFKFGNMWMRLNLFFSFIFYFLFFSNQKFFCQMFDSADITATLGFPDLNSAYTCLNLNNDKNVTLTNKSVCRAKGARFKYAIFDVCKSFWNKSLYDLIDSYQKQKKTSVSYYFTMARFGISYALGTLDPKEAYKAFLKHFKGTSMQELKKNCSQLWCRECKKFIFRDARKLFEKYKRKGVILILTEAGFQELYDDFCLEYKFDYCCTSRLEFRDDKLTGKLLGDPCSGKTKLEQVKNLIENKLGGFLKDAVFYANSHNDIPLLEKVGKPIAVNPDSKLESYAKKKGWKILKFNKIVSCE